MRLCLRAIPKWNGCCSPQCVSAVADSFGVLISASAALAGIVGLILLLGRMLRYTTLGRSPPMGRLLIVTESVALDARRRLHLVRHGERSVLLLTGGPTDLVVGWVDTREPP